MNIVYSTTLSDVAPDTFVTFPGGGEKLWGPATLVWVVFVDAETDQSLDVRVYEESGLYASAFVVETDSIPGDASAHTGFQSTPLPLPTPGWGTNLGVTLAGGSVSHHIYVAAIAL